MPLPQEKRHTLADALTWDEQERVELIYGNPVMMSPPTRAHQRASASVVTQLCVYLDGKNVRSIMHRLLFGHLSEAGTTRKMWTHWWSRTLPKSVIPPNWTTLAAKALQIWLWKFSPHPPIVMISLQGLPLPESRCPRILDR